MTDHSPGRAMESDRKENPRTLADLVFVGFNSRVVALDRYSGEIVWDWKAPDGSGYVSVQIDGDRLIAGVNGYVYCLDPIYGQEVWRNPMKGFGLGVTSIASVKGSTSSDPAAEQARQEAAATSSAASAGAVATG